MGGKLRIKRVAPGQHKPRTSEIAHIRANLASEHWKIFQSRLLRTFNFRIPISPLHQANWQYALRFLREICQPFQRWKRPFPISLDSKSQAIPSTQARVSRQLFKQRQRKIEPRHFFGIKCQTHIEFLGAHRQLQNCIKQMSQSFFAVFFFVTRIKRRKLDRQ